MIQTSATICYGTTSQELGGIIWVWHDLKMWQKKSCYKKFVLPREVSKTGHIILQIYFPQKKGEI